MSDNFYEYEALDIKGNPVSMEKYRNKVVLVVNTASKCGFTPQYEGLQELYKQFAGQGLEILGFPCDQFGHQGPGNSSEISQFCSLNFGVTFPLFNKVEVNGPDAHPLYKFLRNRKPGIIGSSIKWNFTKFLIGPDGTVLKRFAPTVEPEKLIPVIRQLLPSPAQV